MYLCPPQKEGVLNLFDNQAIEVKNAYNSTARKKGQV